MSWIDRDKEVVWHPFTQMKGARIIPIVRGEGAYLYDDEGARYIDAVSSWWVNTHGHSHPYIGDQLKKQFDQLEHVVFAGFTHPQAVRAAERLAGLLPPNIQKVFFSDNGSTAVEIALKMAIQYWWNKGDERTTVVALEGAYHGDTFGSMSVSARSGFTAPFEKHLFTRTYLPTPSVERREEILGLFAQAIESGNVAAFIFEPLVQGARGMVMHDAGVLNEMIRLCKKHGVLAIADEVMTGFGRTGKMFSCDHLENKPDIVCMSKGLTGGVLAMGTTACTNEVFDAFYADEKEKALLHGHSFTGNPLACAVVNASLDLFEKPETWDNIDRISKQQQVFKELIAQNPFVADARCLGTVLAIELKTEDGSSYFSNKGKEAYDYFLTKGIIMRPLGNIIVVLPPYCISEHDLAYVHECIRGYLS